MDYFDRNRMAQDAAPTERFKMFSNEALQHFAEFCQLSGINRPAGAFDTALRPAACTAMAERSPNAQ